MERIYKTKVKKDDHYKNREFILGRISGIQSAICVGPIGHGYGICKDREGNEYLAVGTTAEKYNEFKVFIEQDYPGLCEFDVEYSDDD